MNVLVLLPLLSASGPAAMVLPQPARDTTFYDGSWRHVARLNAVYYGLVTPLDSGRCRIQDYYITGERQLEALGWPGPPVVKDGPATYYFRSSAQRTTGRFANGKREGVWQYWNEDGTLRQKVMWHAGHTVVVFTKEADADSHVPQIVEQMPKFPDKKGVVQYLASTIRRPAGAPPIQGDGKVLVQFIVGPQGNITSTSIIKGIDPTYDAEVLRAVAALPRWQPGLLNGEPTAVRFIVPVVFR
ncbi:energy transducer TonB [Hymenobacter bucti]|uniref:Energy transducer TonB n=1 Tax=Hymenobacter bucti TaxID=1844114 RepID=A0ABW4QX16_9BACT